MARIKKQIENGNIKITKTTIVENTLYSFYESLDDQGEKFLLQNTLKVKDSLYFDWTPLKVAPVVRMKEDLLKALFERT